MFRVFLAFVLFFRKDTEFGKCSADQWISDTYSARNEKLQINDAEKHTNWDLLPRDICGKSGGYRIIGGTEVPLNFFPWIARLSVFTGSQIFFNCAGVLVSSDTVLTAAHCLPFDNLTKLGPIRLGEYNTKTNPDCESGICADPVVDVNPIMVIAPKNYNDSLINHDIAIVKLKNNVTFSESVAPICLGSKNFYEQHFAGRIAEVAGWGYNNVASKNKSVKLQAVKIPILRQEVCRERYERRLNITDRQFCAGGEPGVDACNGDSGGPIMIVDDGPFGPQYFLLGIVSFGPVHCGNPEYPGIYTNMSSFILWVLDNLDGSGRDAYKVTL